MKKETQMEKRVSSPASLLTQTSTMADLIYLLEEGEQSDHFSITDSRGHITGYIDGADILECLVPVLMFIDPSTFDTVKAKIEEIPLNRFIRTDLPALTEETRSKELASALTAASPLFDGENLSGRKCMTATQLLTHIFNRNMERYYAVS